MIPDEFENQVQALIIKAREQNLSLEVISEVLEEILEQVSLEIHKNEQ